MLSISIPFREGLDWTIRSFGQCQAASPNLREVDFLCGIDWLTRSPLNGFSRVHRSAERRQYGVVDWPRQFEKLCVSQAHHVRSIGAVLWPWKEQVNYLRNLKLDWGKRNIGWEFIFLL